MIRPTQGNGYAEKSRVRGIIDGLFRKSKPKGRCPYIRRDEISPYCTKDLQDKPITMERRSVCDCASLQLWCLDKDRYHNCIWYRGTDKFND